MSKRKRTPITDPLLEAIAKCELPVYKLAKETGLQDGSILRFIKGRTSIRLAAADKLAERLGMELVEKKPKAKKRSK